MGQNYQKNTKPLKIAVQSEALITVTLPAAFQTFTVLNEALCLKKYTFF